MIFFSEYHQVLHRQQIKKNFIKFIHNWTDYFKLKRSIVKHKKKLSRKERSRNVFSKASAEVEVSEESKKQTKTSKKVQIKDQMKRILLKKSFTSKFFIVKFSSIKKKSESESQNNLKKESWKFFSSQNTEQSAQQSTFAEEVIFHKSIESQSKPIQNTRENMAAEENDLFNLSFLALQQIADLISSNVDRTVNQAKAKMLKRMNKMAVNNVSNDFEKFQRSQKRWNRSSISVGFQTFNFFNINTFSNVFTEPFSTLPSEPSSGFDLFDDDNERKQSFHHYNSTDFDFFNFNYNGKFIYTDEIVKHFEKNIFFRNVHLFVNKTRNMTVSKKNNLFVIIYDLIFEK